jgi:formamidopyrimidine-DNA glycosylase
MPELPEVETVRAELARHITGKTIDEIDLRRDRIRIPIPDLSGLHGKRVGRVERRAKYLLIHFAKFKDALVIHLGMSGRILLGMGLTRKKHDHVVFIFTDGSEMVFNDARRFGIVTLKSLAGKLFEHLGPEPFSDDFDAAYLYDKLKKRKAPIKPALMDQTLVVGVGNIYASEALFRSKLNPKTPANKLPKPKLAQLVKNIRAVLEDSISAGGSTLRDYRRTHGRIGKFQHKFYVYGKAGKPCPVCKTKIRQITQAGRSSFYCPKCQK